MYNTKICLILTGFGSKGTKKITVVKKTVLPVEKDVKILLSRVCGTNIYNEGEDVPIKPDSEYPEWLWNIRTGPPPALEDMDPNTVQYWKRVRKLALIMKNRQAATQRFKR